MKIKKGDIIQVITGNDKGKTGRVIKVFLDKERVIVEGVNIVKKHVYCLFLFFVVFYSVVLFLMFFHVFLAAGRAPLIDSQRLGQRSPGKREKH